MKKHAVITGGTSGIGQGVAYQLAELGWHVTIVGQNHERGKQIADDIKGAFVPVDLSNLSEVNRFADSVQEPLDALVLCAGVVKFGREPQFTAKGLEVTFALNYLSRFVLSQALLPMMQPQSSFVMVTGDGKYKNVSTDWTTVQTGIPAGRSAALAVDLYAAELARRTDRIRVHTCYPGVVKTRLLDDASWPMRLFMNMLGDSVEKGSSYLVRLVAESLGTVHWNQDKPMQFSPSLDEMIAGELWQYSQQFIPEKARQVL